MEAVKASFLQNMMNVVAMLGILIPPPLYEQHYCKTLQSQIAAHTNDILSNFLQHTGGKMPIAIFNPGRNFTVLKVKLLGL